MKSVLCSLAVGDKVTFAEEKQPYKVRAVSQDGRYAICTKPFNLRKTVLYSIIDFEANRRAPDNMIFCRGYLNDEQIAERMSELISGELELSWRRGTDLKIAEVKYA
jgi:hypothetical protein